MKSDIDTIMQAKNLDALVVFGHGEQNLKIFSENVAPLVKSFYNPSKASL